MRTSKVFLTTLWVTALSVLSPAFAVASHQEEKKTDTVPFNLPLKDKKILFVLSSKAKLGGESPRKAGVWAESLAAPYEILTQQGAKISLASVEGGKAPVDPRSENSDFATAYTKQFRKDAQGQELLAHTMRLSDVQAADYDAICYTSSYGMFYDLVDNPDSIRLLTEFERAKKPIGLTSQGPLVLKNVKDAKGGVLVKGKVVTAFRNSEEAGSKLALDHNLFPISILKTMDHGRTYRTAALPEDQFLKELKLVGTVPFLTETLLKSQGAVYKSRKNWESFVVEDLTNDGAILLTAQNPDSIELWSKAFIQILLNQQAVETKIATGGAREFSGEGEGLSL
ncbi:type 1 glutamine amidotransferase domain-containing protein [Acetobacteraceae bacterium]|nr:type 1 glutamine amidotransferase domain-containing protein [Acetobacteraceae bacterium]